MPARSPGRFVSARETPSCPWRTPTTKCPCPARLSRTLHASASSSPAAGGPRADNISEASRRDVAGGRTTALSTMGSSEVGQSDELTLNTLHNRTLHGVQREKDWRVDHGARFFGTRARTLSKEVRRGLVSRDEQLSVRRQCLLLGVNRSSLYHQPVADSDEELQLMRKVDELHRKHPFYGSWRIAATLKSSGPAVNRKRIQRVMRKMGVESIAPKPNTSKPCPEHIVFPCLLRHRVVERVNDIWAADITYIPMAHGSGYLVAIIDWYSRRLLSWRLSNTMDTRFCIEALQDAIETFGRPTIFNTDQGAQFTSTDFTGYLVERDIKGEHGR
jgi:putative transposase